MIKNRRGKTFVKRVIADENDLEIQLLNVHLIMHPTQMNRRMKSCHFQQRKKSVLQQLYDIQKIYGQSQHEVRCHTGTCSEVI